MGLETQTWEQGGAGLRSRGLGCSSRPRKPQTPVQRVIGQLMWAEGLLWEAEKGEEGLSSPMLQKGGHCSGKQGLLPSVYSSLLEGLP